MIHGGVKRLDLGLLLRLAAAFKVLNGPAHALIIHGDDLFERGQNRLEVC